MQWKNMKQKVIFFIVPSSSNNRWLDEKMLQVTQSFIGVLNSHDNYLVEIISTFDSLNLYLDKAELLIVLRAGNVIFHPSKILRKIKSIPEDVGLLGHILKTTPKETPYLHDQMLIIRTNAFEKLDFDSLNDTGPEIIRSEEDLHAGRAPLFVTLANNTVERKHKFGTKLIIDCLSNNYKVINFDNEWRWNLDPADNFVPLENVNKKIGDQLDYFPSKGFCYPEKQTTIFSQALKDLQILPNLDNAQEILIAIIQETLKFKILNAWTYDIADDVPKKDVAICPATGFFGEVTAIKSGARKLVLYDKNPFNIQFKKDLYEYWDGKNYKDFVVNWNKDKQLKIEPVFDINNPKKDAAYTEAETLLFPIWHQWRNRIDVKFLNCDLIADIDTLLAENNGNTLLYTSTILGDYPMTHFVYSKEQIQKVKDKIFASNIFWLN
jgi:hypothetical protein